jgi:salicylate hydroxylase
LVSPLGSRNNTHNLVADGIHSRLRNIVLNSDIHFPKKTGLTCYRVAISTIEAKAALDDLPLPTWWDSTKGGNRTSIIYAPDATSRMVVAYPICNHEAFNFSCILRKPEITTKGSDVWNINGDKEELLQEFGDFNEPLKRILR